MLDFNIMDANTSVVHVVVVGSVGALPVNESFAPTAMSAVKHSMLSGEVTDLTVGLLVRYLVSYSVPLLLILVSSRLWLQYVCLSKEHAEPQAPLPPGSMGLPFIGETLHLLLKGTAFFTRRRHQYGNIFKTHLLGRPTVRIIGASNVRRILMAEHTLVSTQWPVSTQKIFGDGALALSSGAVHKERRKAVMKAFNQEALRSYVRPMQGIVRNYLHRWCTSGRVLGYPACKELTFNIAATLLVGCNIPENESVELLNIFQEMTGNVFSLPVMVPGTGLYKAVRAREAIITRLEKYLRTPEDGTDDSTCPNCDSTGYDSVLGSVMAGTGTDGKGMTSRRELLEAALELLFAGHETTASAACATLLHLAQNPDVVEKVCTELYEHGLLMENDGSDLTYDSINQLSYTNLVVREILRISPPIGGAFRQALRTFEIGGYRIPKGWTLVYSIRDTHQTSTAFDDVDTFKPDRWLPHPDHSATADSSGARAKHDFLPFGSGSRACVGKEFAKLLLKILTIELVRNCSWFLVNNKTQIAQLPVPHPKDDLPIVIKQVTDFRRRAYTV